MKGLVIALGLLCAAAVAFALAQSGIKVTLDGKPLSSRGFVKDGLVYIPANDVAKALGKTYAYDKAKKSARLGSAGGAFQTDGIEGKAGETLFNGITRFTVGTTLTPGEPYTILEIEARNAEKSNKTYKFGFTSTRYTVFDAAGIAIEGEMKNNDYYAVPLAQAEFRKVPVSFKFPAGFVPVRMVVRLETQVSGNPPRSEIFRITF